MLQNTLEATLTAGARWGDCPCGTGGRCPWPPAWLDRGWLRGAERLGQQVKTTKPGEIPPFHTLIEHGSNRQWGLRGLRRDVLQGEQSRTLAHSIPSAQGLGVPPVCWLQS